LGVAGVFAIAIQDLNGVNCLYRIQGKNMATKTIPRAAKSPVPEPAAPSTPTAAKPAAKTTVRRKAQPAAAAKGPVAVRQVKPKAATVEPTAVSPAKVTKKPAKPRPVLVRDSFTMPETDFALIAKLKSTALGARRAAKKSELLRAGLHILAGLDAESLVVVLDRLETVKTGRPKKGH
jgi:hypothetical protein